ncbi:MAG: type II toxin-antitoxin system prevent-host-death family antitoxin [Parabacteroides sp.]|nr:type II toxin-antitoxin system prevent-host-death family antitoxin [Parabacteroides sp.]
MIIIRPVSDLRNKFTEIENSVKQGQPVYLTKNGYGSMVVLSLEQYAALTDEIEIKLDEADKAATADNTRYSEDEVFGRVRERINGYKAVKAEVSPSI